MDIELENPGWKWEIRSPYMAMHMQAQTPHGYFHILLATHTPAISIFTFSVLENH